MEESFRCCLELDRLSRDCDSASFCRCFSFLRYSALTPGMAVLLVSAIIAIGRSGWRERVGWRRVGSGE